MHPPLPPPELPQCAPSTLHVLPGQQTCVLPFVPRGQHGAAVFGKQLTGAEAGQLPPPLPPEPPPLPPPAQQPVGLLVVIAQQE